MFGLTIRWSLLGALDGVNQALRAYVPKTSEPRFRGLPGLVEKRWQMVDGGFFAGIYVFSTAESRASFLESFRSNPSPVSQLVGHDPDVVQEWDLVGRVTGPDGPLSSS